VAYKIYYYLYYELIQAALGDPVKFYATYIILAIRLMTADACTAKSRLHEAGQKHTYALK
jgi:hypothetical protein